MIENQQNMDKPLPEVVKPEEVVMASSTVPEKKRRKRKPRATTYSPLSQKLFDLLKDGEPHLNHDVLKHLGDEWTDMYTVHCAVYSLKKKLPNGITIISQYFNRRFYYRMVRLLNSPIE